MWCLVILLVDIFLIIHHFFVHSDSEDSPSVLPLLNIGFNRVR